MTVPPPLSCRDCGNSLLEVDVVIDRVPIRHYIADVPIATVTCTRCSISTVTSWVTVTPPEIKGTSEEKTE